ncbi:MAG: DUF2779 domain-containing protein [Nanoarchaeota archaeon]
MEKNLSKSKYLNGLQCPKLLWIAVNKKELIPPADKCTQFTFDQGYLVGELAKKLFPKGINISTEDFTENLKQSKELLKKRKPLFEVAFSINRIYSRADVLNPVGKDEWDLIEVKSSSDFEGHKKEYIQDISFQKYCYERAGIKIRKCFLMHINKEYVKKGEIEPKKLFVKKELTQEANEEMKSTQERIDEMLEVISSKKRPEVKIGKRCNNPHLCPLIEECWKFLPVNSVFNLYGKGKTCEDLFEKGVIAIKDIPEDYVLNDKQGIQRKCEKTGKPYVQKEQIKQFLKTLHYPLYFLDFETFGTAVPLYDGIKPWQNVPFQFSLHVVKKKKPEHFHFLASGKSDPRKELLAELKKMIGSKGSIIAYNASFEKGVLEELAKSYPGSKKWIKNALSRIVDLIIPFRNFYYHHPKQQGSASLKKVLPALVRKDYADLEVSGGMDASLAFLDLTFEKIPEKDRERLRKDLEEYCERDTEGMIWIVEKLIELSKDD